MQNPEPAPTSKQNYELMAMFERIFRGRRLDREAKEFWARGHVYQDGAVNDLFLAFRQGAAYGSAVTQQQG